MKSVKKLFKAQEKGKRAIHSDPHDGGSSAADSAKEQDPVRDTLFPGRDTRGLRILHTPEEPVIDVIFIHGLTGDSFRTWRHKSGTYWPVDLLRKDMSNARILIFGYDADVTKFLSKDGKVGNGTVRTHAGTLVAEVGALRRANDASRPIILVTHSLGGLVSQKALCISAEAPEEHHKQLDQCTIGLFFLGTPHRGSELADYAVVVSKILALADRQLNKRTLGVLRPDSEGG